MPTRKTDAGKAGVEVDDRGFIRVTNSQHQRAASLLSAISAGQPMLAHKGVHEGHVAAEVIAGKKHYFDPVIPLSIAVHRARSGMGCPTEKEAKEKGISYENRHLPVGSFWVKSIAS